MTDKEEFISIYKEKITREGADKLLDFLENRSDFFTAPASTRYHNAFEGGLLRHSLNVYHCLTAYLDRERVKNEYELNVSDETPPSSHCFTTSARLISTASAGVTSKTSRPDSGKSSPGTRYTTPCPTVTEKSQCTWSADLYGCPARRLWRYAGIWDSPEWRTRTLSVRRWQCTRWRSRFLSQIWKLLTSLKEIRNNISW